MMEYHFKKVSFGELPKSDPSFYKRFNTAWINYRENELEARLQTLGAPRKRKPQVREAF